MSQIIKVYSKIHEIPDGMASENTINGCLCAEGGGFRGLYTVGVMDALMENDINLNTVIGVSAGAMSGVNYITGQIGRSARVDLTYRHYSGFMGAKAVTKRKTPVNLDFLIKGYDKIEPIDRKRFNNKNKRFIAVATDCETGETTYFEKGKSRHIMTAVKASGSLPFISPMVSIEGRKYLDGGCSCKIPYEWALKENFEKIVVIKTRENGFRKKETGKADMAFAFYKNYPQFARKLHNSNRDYNRQCDELEDLQALDRVFVIAPSKPVKVSRLEGDMEKLGDLYWQGYNDGISVLPELKKYLGL